MALTIDSGTDASAEGNKVKPGKRLYLTAPRGSDEARLVEEGHPDAYELFCTEASEVPRKEYERYKTKESKGYEDKSGSGPDDEDGSEEWTLTTSPAEYLERYPDGPNADLARKLVED